MTLYADKDTRKTWRIKYGIPMPCFFNGVYDFWGRRGGAPSGCVLALAYAIEQVDADEVLMRQALEALETVQADVKTTSNAYETQRQAVALLKERLG